MKPHLSISQSDFSIIRKRGDYYVDKSLFVQEVIDGSDVLLITRPRRFGKTLNMSMLRYFYGNDADHSNLFQNLHIMGAGERYLAKMGKHPVVFMSFKDVKYDNWADAFDDIKDSIFAALSSIEAEYPNLRHQLDKKEQGILERFMAQEPLPKDFTGVLKTLCHALAIQHGANPVVLIDEYDTPMTSAWVADYYKPCVSLMRNFLSGLKDNLWLEKAVMTGVIRVSKESLFSGLNNLSVWSVLNDRAADKFGFTDKEVEQLLKACGLHAKEMDKVRQWYNGYTFGQMDIYNPWSILNYADAPQDGFRTYWANTSDNLLLRKLLFSGEGSIREDIDALLQGEWLTKTINENLVFQDLGHKKDAVWNLLLASGYLKRRNSSYNPNTRGYVCQVAIPNMEVDYVYAQSIKDWVGERMPEARFTEMVEYLVKGDMEGFENLLDRFLQGTASFHDTANPESFYHALFLGMLGHFSDRFWVKSNRESGKGRYDIALIPRKPGGPGAVIEIKTPSPRKKQTLQDALQDALEQLANRRYDTELLERGAAQVTFVALAVQGKEFLVQKR